jgi:hypothetical protein
MEPSGITAGPDGNLWFTEFTSNFSSNKIGQINPTTHAIAEFPTPTGASEPVGIAPGSLAEPIAVQGLHRAVDDELAASGSLGHSRRHSEAARGSSHNSTR